MKIPFASKKLEKVFILLTPSPYFIFQAILDFTTSIIEFEISDGSAEFNISARNMMAKYGALKGLIFYDMKYLWPIELCFLTYLISTFLEEKIKSLKLKRINQAVKGISVTDLMAIGGAHFLQDFGIYTFYHISISITRKILAYY